MLSDPEAQRIADQVGNCADRGTMTRWVRSLLDDRKARSALILGLSRQLHHTKGRLAQAAKYLDGLLDKAHQRTREPWPKQDICPRCGAPADSAKALPTKPAGHRVVTGHPDGTTCEAEPKLANPNRTSPDPPTA